jgi:uncharacterized protein (TIGR03382 family)
LTYEDFFDSMSRFVACNYGTGAYEVFNQSLCDHMIRDCSASPPTTCQTCGNGIREGDEACDGNDLSIPELGAVTTCEDLGFDGGTLLCAPDSECQEFDTSACMVSGADTTAGGGGGGGGGGASASASMGGNGGSTGSTGDDAGAGGGAGSCACSTSDRAPSPLWAMMSLWWLALRRRRTLAARVVIGGTVALAALHGCSDRHVGGSGDGDDAGGSSTVGAAATGDVSTTIGTSAAASTGSEPLPGWPDAWAGTYHQRIARLGEDIREPDAFGAFPNLFTLSAGKLRRHGFTCAGEPAIEGEYDVVPDPADPEVLRLVNPSPSAESLYPVGTTLALRPGETCGELVLEVDSPVSSGPPSMYPWVLGELCLTNSCDEDEFDEFYQQDLCPGTITECAE